MDNYSTQYSKSVGPASEKWKVNTTKIVPKIDRHKTNFSTILDDDRSYKVPKLKGGILD